MRVAQRDGQAKSTLLVRAVRRSFQENVTPGGPGRGASYSLVGAIILLGGLGYAVDRWWARRPGVCSIGLMLGMVVGFYELVKALGAMKPVAWMVAGQRAAWLAWSTAMLGGPRQPGGALGDRRSAGRAPAVSWVVVRPRARSGAGAAARV